MGKKTQTTSTFAAVFMFVLKKQNRIFLKILLDHIILTTAMYFQKTKMRHYLFFNCGTIQNLSSKYDFFSLFID